MMMKTVVVISHDEDAHAQRVLERASEMGVRGLLWDVSTYPQSAQITLPLYDSRIPSIVIEGQEIPRGVQGFFWRRPNGKYHSSSVSKMDQYMKKEGGVVVSALGEYFSEANWISSPWAEVKGGNKPYQLLLAKRFGWKIPLTCISNNPEEVRQFIAVLGPRKLTMKPAGTAFMDLSEEKNFSSIENKVVFTKIIDSEEVLANIDMIKNCPVIFQEAIHKEYDLRITVVDDVTHVAKITLEGCDDPDNLDWKNWQGVRRYSTEILPREVEQKCVDIVRSLGLRFGCVDLGFSSREGYTFFEVNPQGQWLPSEDRLGYDVSGSIVRALVR